MPGRSTTRMQKVDWCWVMVLRELWVCFFHEPFVVWNEPPDSLLWCCCCVFTNGVGCCLTSYAVRNLSPDILIDMATLTGAQGVCDAVACNPLLPVHQWWCGCYRLAADSPCLQESRRASATERCTATVSRSSDWRSRLESLQVGATWLSAVPVPCCWCLLCCRLLCAVLLSWLRRVLDWPTASCLVRAH